MDVAKAMISAIAIGHMHLLLLNSAHEVDDNAQLRIVSHSCVNQVVGCGLRALKVLRCGEVCCDRIFSKDRKKLEREVLEGNMLLATPRGLVESRGEFARQLLSPSLVHATTGGSSAFLLQISALEIKLPASQTNSREETGFP